MHEGPWVQAAIDAVMDQVDDIASSAAGMEGVVPLDERNAQQDAEAIVQAVVAIMDDAGVTVAPSEEKP